MNFKDLSLSDKLQKALEQNGFSTPTEIQEKAIPLLLEQSRIDFHGQAPTGTGKTLAFGLPLLHHIDIHNKNVQALIVAPTRELVIQICRSLQQVAIHTNCSIVALYGGVSIIGQIKDLKRGAQIVVGTPGRLLDLLQRKALSLKNLSTLVLDEADIMLDMGFKEEITELLSHAPEDRNIWLFSATIKSGIQDIKREFMRKPVFVSVNQKDTTLSLTKQYYVLISRDTRFEALCRFVDSAPEFYGMIFCQTKLLASEIAEKLNKRGYAVSALHGDMDQKMRDAVMKRFRERAFSVLVATDVASRGLDIADLTHVINYTLPDDQESYIHRIGRTGRAGKEGIAITFLGQRDLIRLKQLARRFNMQLHQAPIPRVQDIAQARALQAVEYLQKVTTYEQHSPMVQPLRDAILQLSQEQLVNGLTKILADNFLQAYKSSNDSIEQVQAKENSFDNNDATVQEIMLPIGTEDGITKRDIIHYCAEIDRSCKNAIKKIRVIRKRSFIVVDQEAVSHFISLCSQKHFRGRKIRATVVANRENSLQFNENT